MLDIEGGTAVLRRLEQETLRSIRDHPDIKINKSINFTGPKRDLVLLVVRGKDPEQMRKLVGAPISDLIRDHNEILTAGQSELREAAGQLRARLDSEPARRAEIEARINRMQILVLKHEPTRLVRSATTYDVRIGPVFSLYLFLSSLGGLWIGFSVIEWPRRKPT